MPAASLNKVNTATAINRLATLSKREARSDALHAAASPALVAQVLPKVCVYRRLIVFFVIYGGVPLLLDGCKGDRGCILRGLGGRCVCVGGGGSLGAWW